MSEAARTAIRRVLEPAAGTASHRSNAGREFEISVGWMLYHILEHRAGHYYEIKLPRHQYRIAHAPGGSR